VTRSAKIKVTAQGDVKKSLFWQKQFRGAVKKGAKVVWAKKQVLCKKFIRIDNLTDKRDSTNNGGERKGI